MSITIQLNSPPPGEPPSLARLAWNRLAFGPRPEDLAGIESPTFSLADFVDQQLDYESIDDSACEAYIQNLSRTDPDGGTVPPLDASMAELKSYRNQHSAGRPTFSATSGQPLTLVRC